MCVGEEGKRKKGGEEEQDGTSRALYRVARGARTKLQKGQGWREGIGERVGRRVRSHGCELCEVAGKPGCGNGNVEKGGNWKRGWRSAAGAGRAGRGRREGRACGHCNDASNVTLALSRPLFGTSVVVFAVFIACLAVRAGFPC